MSSLLEQVSSPDSPWWVKPAYALGVPAAIAMFLVVFVAVVVVSAQRDLKTQLAEHDQRARAQTELLFQICLNIAKEDVSAVARCQAVQR